MLYIFKRFKKRENQILTATIMLSALMSACGGSAYREVKPAPAAPAAPTTSTTSKTTSYASPTPSSSPTAAAQDTNFLPSISLEFSKYGTSTALTQAFDSPPITTDNLLKVELTAGPAGTANLPGSNWTFQYDCIMYKVSLVNTNGTVLRTDDVMLKVSNGNALCQGAERSKVLDYSPYMTSGHGTVSIRVQGALYDYYPVHYPYQYSGMTSIYNNHNITGHIAIQVNGTGL